MASRRKRPARASARTGRATRARAAAIERELNTNPKARQAFLKSPTAYLSGKGLKLGAQQRKDLNSMVTELKRGPGGRAAALLKPKITVIIGIRIRF